MKRNPVLMKAYGTGDFRISVGNVDYFEVRWEWTLLLLIDGALQQDPRLITNQEVFGLACAADQEPDSRLRTRRPDPNCHGDN